MLTKFFLLSTYRSGSTWLIDLLNSHPAVVAYEELFLDDDEAIPRWAGERSVVRWHAYRESMLRRDGTKGPFGLGFKYLDTVLSEHDRDRLGASGLKVMYKQWFMTHRFTLAYAALRRVKILHLVRKNLLDTFVSEKCARLRGQFHSYRDVEQVSIFVDTDELMQWLRRQEKKVAMARSALFMLGLPTLEVTYESLLTEGESCFPRVLGFLGVDSRGASLQSRLRKLNRQPHHRTIKNYDDVRSALGRTRFAPLLQD